MGPAGQQDGSLPGGPTQTAVGRPPRTEPRGATEEMDLRTMLAVKDDVRERMAAAMALVDGAILLAEEAVLECEQGRKPVLASAGRFVRRGGCGCATCVGTPYCSPFFVELVLPTIIIGNFFILVFDSNKRNNFQFQFIGIISWTQGTRSYAILFCSAHTDSVKSP
eukprot:COSAG05_NODE_599_length_8442_cov_52.187268_10_plen_166_part_00